VSRFGHCDLREPASKAASGLVHPHSARQLAGPNRRVPPPGRRPGPGPGRARRQRLQTCAREASTAPHGTSLLALTSRDGGWSSTYLQSTALGPPAPRPLAPRPGSAPDLRTGDLTRRRPGLAAPTSSGHYKVKVTCSASCRLHPTQRSDRCYKDPPSPLPAVHRSRTKTNSRTRGSD